MRRPNNFTPGPEALSELAQAHSFFAVTNTGIELLDPHTKESIHPACPPAIVRTDLSMSRGLDYLASRGQDDTLQTTLIFSPHRSGMDFYNTLISSESSLVDAPIVALNSRSKAVHQPYGPESLFAQSTPGYGDFQKAVHKWFANMGKNALPCDYDVRRPDSKLHGVFRQHIKELRQAKALNADTHGYEAPTMLQNAIRMSYDTLRQWALLGKLGALLLEADSAGVEIQEVPYLVDLKHTAVVDKLASLGVATNVHVATERIKQTEAETLHRMVYADMTKQARASFTQLKMPLPS